MCEESIKEENSIEIYDFEESQNEVSTNEFISIVDVRSLNDASNFGEPEVYYEVQSLDEQPTEINTEPILQMLPLTLALMKRKSLHYMGLHPDRFSLLLELARKQKLSEEKVMLVLRKLRLKEDYETLGDLFDLDKKTAEKYFNQSKFTVAELVGILTPTTASTTKKPVFRTEQSVKVEVMNEGGEDSDVEPSPFESSASSLYYCSEADPNVKVKNLEAESCESDDYSERSYNEYTNFRNVDTLTCGLCWKKCETNVLLKTHQKTVHQAAYLCDLCGKKFYNKKSIKRHVLWVHAKIMNYRCDTCGERFAYNEALKYHQKSAHLNGSRKRNVKCSSCDMKYFDQRALDLHVRAKHTYKAPFKCKVCGKTFTRAYNYKVHERTHNV